MRLVSCVEQQYFPKSVHSNASTMNTASLVIPQTQLTRSRLNHPSHHLNMASAGRMLKWGKKDPELYVLMAIYAGIFGAAGFHLGMTTYIIGANLLGKKGGNVKPEANVSIPHEGMPWEGPNADANRENPDFKYEYHPGGDPSREAKQAPGALHSHTIMARLPDDLREKFNKAIN